MTKGHRVQGSRRRESEFQVAGEHAATGTHLAAGAPVDDVPAPVEVTPVDDDEHGAAWKEIPATVVQEVARFAVRLLANHLRDESGEIRRVKIPDARICEDVADGGRPRQIGIRNLDDARRFAWLRPRDDRRRERAPDAPRRSFVSIPPELGGDVPLVECGRRDVLVKDEERRRRLYRRQTFLHDALQAIMPTKGVR